MQAISFFVPLAFLLLLKTSCGALNDEITPLELPLGKRNFDIKEHSEEIPLEDIGVNMLSARPKVVRQVEAPEEENIQIIAENFKEDLEYIPLEQPRKRSSVK